MELEECQVTGKMNNSYQNANENVQNIMIYQSMSGDSEIGHSDFSATGGSITTK